MLKEAVVVCLLYATSQRPPTLRPRNTSVTLAGFPSNKETGISEMWNQCDNHCIIIHYVSYVVARIRRLTVVGFSVVVRYTIHLPQLKKMFRQPR